MNGMQQPSPRRRRLRKQEPIQGDLSTLALEGLAAIEITDPDDTEERPAVKKADSLEIPSATLSAFSLQSGASGIALPITPILPSLPDLPLSEEIQPDDSVISPPYPAPIVPSVVLPVLSMKHEKSKAFHHLQARFQLITAELRKCIKRTPIKDQNLRIPGTMTRRGVYLSRTLLTGVLVVAMLLLRFADVPGQSALPKSSTNSMLIPAHTGRTAAHAASTPAITASSLGDWPTYMGDDGHSGFNAAENTITPATAHTLKLKWTQSAGDAVVSQPIVSNGLIYWASWDGFEYATDLNGKTVWATNLGTTTPKPICVPPHLGVSSSATIADVAINGTVTPVDFLGGGNGNFYALNALTGAIIWKTFLGTPPAHYLWSSPTLYNGSIYMGVASVGDCPLVQGQLVQMDATTGRIQHIFNTVPDGCVGGGIWSSPTIDEATGTVYISTGTIHPCHLHERYAIGLVELRASDLSLIQSWQVPRSERIHDGDFGATPTLFSTSVGVPMVGLVNKNGIYYAFKRDDLSSQVWETRIATTGINISSSAWDGHRLYVGGRRITINGVTCRDSVMALNPDDGAIIWQHCLANTRYTGAVVAVPGLVVMGQGPYVTVLDATSGQLLANLKSADDSSHFWGWASISHGVLYIGDTKGRLYAFAP